METKDYLTNFYGGYDEEGRLISILQKRLM